MDLAIKMVKVEIGCTISYERCAEVYILDQYMGRFPVNDYDDSDAIEWFIVDQVFSPALEAAKQKYGVTDDSE